MHFAETPVFPHFFKENHLLNEFQTNSTAIKKAGHLSSETSGRRRKTRILSHFLSEIDLRQFKSLMYPDHAASENYWQPPTHRCSALAECAAKQNAAYHPLQAGT